MGLTLADNVNNFDKDITTKGMLTETFRFGSFSETQSANDADFNRWLSLDTIEQAEWSLGHILDEQPRIEDAIIAHNDNAIIHLFSHKIAPYSVDDTITEQNTVEESDANLSTASGYLKKQLFDPTAHSENQDIKRRKDWDLVKALDEHEREMARLAVLIDKIEKEIDEIDAKIAKLDQDIEEKNQRLEDLNELADFAEGGGDVRNLSAVKQRRLNNLLAAHGKKIEEKPDGSIDNDALARDLREIQKREENARDGLEDQKDSEQARRDELDQQLQEYKKEYNALKEQRDGNVVRYDQAVESGDTAEITETRQVLERENTAKSVELLSEQEKLDKFIDEASPSPDKEEHNTLDIGGFDLALLGNEISDFAKEFSLFDDEENEAELTSSEIETETASKDNGVGSVAAAAGGEVKVISSEFSRVNATTPDTTPTEPDNGMVAKNDDTYTAPAARLPGVA
ncbi:MAG: hypothetical protein ACRBDL_05740 [Alphaproteobacteria bacterium]